MAQDLAGSPKPLPELLREGPRIPLIREQNDIELARMAAIGILGQPGLVGTSSANLWYTSGASRLYYVTSDLLYPPDISDVDIGRYFARFDALAQDAMTSPHTWNRQRKTLSAFYADQTLQLRGFFFGDRHGWDQSALSYLLFSSQRPSPLTGYGSRQGALFRFVQEDAGDHIFASSICPIEVLNGNPMKLDFFASYYLPATAADQPIREAITTFLVDSETAARALPLLDGQCTSRDIVRGVVERVTVTDLPNHGSRSHAPVEFVWDLEARGA
jgi:hypothetical protein